jgi:hypothetical protein
VRAQEKFPLGADTTGPMAPARGIQTVSSARGPCGIPEPASSVADSFGYTDELAPSSSWRSGAIHLRETAKALGLLVRPRGLQAWDSLPKVALRFGEQLDYLAVPLRRKSGRLSCDIECSVREDSGRHRAKLFGFHTLVPLAPPLALAHQSRRECRVKVLRLYSARLAVRGQVISRHPGGCGRCQQGDQDDHQRAQWVICRSAQAVQSRAKAS